MDNKEVDDVDDDLFISKKPQSYIFAETKERTTKSLSNCKNLIYESEVVSRGALEDLAIQREKLDRTESGLDSINAMNRVTQKHLNNMRSWFGGIKSLFYDASKDNNALKNEIKGMSKSSTIANFPYGSPVSSSGANPVGSIISTDYSSTSGRSAGPSNLNSGFSKPSLAKANEPVDDFDNDLAEVGMGLGKLKELAMQLGDEIGEQNDQLDRITDKTDRAGDSIKHQNRHMQQLLKKG